MARFDAAAAAAVALLLFLVAAASTTSTSAQPVTVTVPQPPAWIYNKTEWRSRLYNSLRLTPAQVEAFETVLDARDALKAPLRNATWSAVRAAAAAERAKLRNATAARALAKPLLSLGNSTVVAARTAKENALNATEIKLRAAASAVSSAGASAGAPGTVAASLIASALNLTADAVDRHLQDMLTVDQYREAAWRSKLQAQMLSTAEEQGAFATLGSFSESVAPVTTPPAPISTPAAGAASGDSSSAASSPEARATAANPQSPEDAAAAEAFLAAAAALPKTENLPATRTTPVRQSDSDGDGSPAVSVFAKVGGAGKAPSSSSSSSPGAAHPSSLVDASDADIASWLSQRPSEADSADEREHLDRLASWVAAAEELSLDDDEVSDDAVQEAAAADVDADAGLDAEVTAYARLARSALAGVASSDAAPEGGVTSPEVTAEAAEDEQEEGEKEANEEEAKPAELVLPASLSASASAFFRRRSPNGTVSRSTPNGLAPEEGPPAAVGAPTYPATSLDAMALQASPAIKDYYRYLALRCMGFSKALAATAVAATEDRSLSTAIKYCLTSLKVELADGAEPVWLGQAATPFVVSTGTANSFSAQDAAQGKRKKRSRSMLSADEAAPAAPASSSSSAASSSSATSTTRKLQNFGTQTSPPPPPSPPPPGPSPPPPSPPSPPSPSPPPPPPPSATYTSYRADNTQVSTQKNGGFSSDPPDGGLCAGAGFIISMENEIASVRAQSDPATALRTVSLFSFFQGASGDGYGDPHCLYHAPSGRFFAVAYQTSTNTAATFVPLAMSAVNDPLGTWTIYRINTWNNVAAGLSNCNAQTPCFGDYPQIGANADSIWVTTNQFAQSGNSLFFAGTLITAFAVSNLVAGGTQTPFQTGSIAVGSVKPMVVSGPTANYPTGTMYLLTTQTSTTLRLLTYTNTGNLASNTAPTLASQRTVTSSISIGGAGSYGNAQLASGTQFDGGDDRLIGLSYANGRMLASCTSYYGSTAASPKLGVVYWFIDVASATQVYAGLFADASWNAWSMSTVLDPSNPNGGLMAGMLATYPGFTVSFPTASVLVQVVASSGALNSAALVTSQDGQYLRGFTNPVRTGDYSTSVVDPATGVAWLLSEQGQTYATTNANNWGTVVWKSTFT